MSAFNLEAIIGLNTEKFQRGLSDAGKSMSSFGSTIKSGAEKIAKVGAAAFTTLTAAATATTAAILKGVDAYTSYGDNIDKMSQKLGMSAQAYQEWDAVMQHSGTSIDAMQASMKTLASAAETGNDAFEQLGLSQEAIANMSQEELFSATITALQNVDNETQRTYLAGKLLGRGATELGALLNTSAEETERMKQRVHELGGVMSDEAVKASAKYKDSIQDMKTAFKGMGRDLISDFVPALTTVSDGLAAIFSGNENGAELFTKGFNDALATLSSSASKLKPVIKKIASVAVEVIPQIIGTVSQGILEAAPVWIDYGKNALKNIAEGLSNADFDVNDNVFTKLLSSIVGNSADYFKYAQQILSNLANRLLDVDYGALASNISTVFVNAINSMTDFVKSIDFYKVGENIADFLNGIDWQKVANSIFDLLASGIKGLGDIAVSFFANADLGNLMTMIGVLGAPKLLGGLTNFIGGAEGKEIGKAAGMSWSNAFMAGIEAFGLGWAIGTWLRDHIEFGGKTLGEWVDEGTEKFFGDIPETEEEFDNSYNTGWINYNGKLMKINPSENPELYAKYNPQAYASWYEKHGRFTRYKGINVPEPEMYGDGGRVTRPTFAIVGEKEPETIIPDSKMNSIGNTTNYITINVEGYNIKNDEEFTELLSRKLSELSVRQQRALGGAGW